MRAAWVVCLVGCYQPNGEAPCTVACTTVCPSHLSCVNGWCTNGPRCGADGGVLPDANDDAAMQAPCAAPTTLASDTQLTIGSWFSARLNAERYAMKFSFEDNGAGPIGVIRGTRNDPGALYALLFSDDGIVEYRSPHVSPDGLEMFMRLNVVSVGPTIARSVRTVGTDIWSNPSGVMINALPPIAMEDTPSSPTKTFPRRMVISHAVGFSEIREISDTSWQVVRDQPQISYLNADATPVSFLGDAHLTEDGLRLVFRGQIAMQTIGAFYLQRASLDDPFEAPARQLPTLGSVATPFFTSDCRFLFYHRNNDGFTYRVAYP